MNRAGHDESVELLVDEALASNKVVVFSKTSCPYCTMAKNALRAAGAEFTTIELNKVREGRDIQRHLQALTGRRTVPNVFVNGQSIGGGDETVRLQRSGRLAQLVA